MEDKLSEIAIVGSGPSGISAAKAFLKQGLPVTMIDAGHLAPSDIVEFRDELASTAPQQWSADQLDRARRSVSPARGQLPQKTLFGSDYPYHFDERVREHGASIVGSLARGGFSNVWGASILPLSDEDSARWPFPIGDLSPHYAAVLDWMPHAQRADDLAGIFPMHSASERPLKLSSQAAALLSDLQDSRDQLAGNGITFGQARLAIRDCQYCTLCLNGCPYQYIYHSGQTLEELRRDPGFTYLGKTTVERVSESATGVSLQVNADGQRHSLAAGRVFLGGGVLNTAMLLMPLLQADRLTVRDSTYFLLPFLRYQRAGPVRREALYTLSQLFMRILDPGLCSKSIHLQWYSYNDIYRQELAARLGPLRRLLPGGLTDAMLDRLWTIQGFLHSDDSHSIELRVDGSGDRATVSKCENPETEQILRRVYRKLGLMSKHMRGRTVTALGITGVPGRSFHAGATFPMAAEPGALQSDTYGRPTGLQRIHIIDSSALPMLAASTVTLTVMANAHRIASQYRQYGDAMS